MKYVITAETTDKTLEIDDELFADLIIIQGMEPWPEMCNIINAELEISPGQKYYFDDGTEFTEKFFYDKAYEWYELRREKE